MLVGGIALRAPVRVGAGKKTDDPYAMLEARFTPRTVFMDIASADPTLAARAASYVERVYAIDVSGRPVHSLRPRCNLRVVACDGVRIPVPEASVDIAWSGDFMDRLAEGDIPSHLASVHGSLATNGEYLFTTQRPVAEVRKRLFDAGFSVVRVALLSLLLKPLRITAIK
jgi:hypothetical protein